MQEFAIVYIKYIVLYTTISWDFQEAPVLSSKSKYPSFILNKYLHI